LLQDKKVLASISATHPNFHPYNQLSSKIRGVAVGTKKAIPTAHRLLFQKPEANIFFSNTADADIK
jgi:hypothetical protein